MLRMVVGVLAGEETGASGAITAAWDDISISGDPGSNRIESSTVTFTGGGSRKLLLEHDVTTGSIAYRIGTSGIFTSFSSGTSIYVTTGQTVSFRYSCSFADESATLTVTDVELTATVDTIALDFTYTG